ncbi:hypothetical protein VTI74DRAFT_4315 [Chaetomium olivicolor]
MDHSMLTNAISIPYHSLHQLSAVFMDHVEDALQIVTGSPRDTRRAAAWVELAVCHASCITRHFGPEFGGDFLRASATSALLNAAELGDTWARAVVLRVSEALGQLVPERYDIRCWLFDAASKGSFIALESLVEVSRGDATEALRTYRKTFCGNPSQLYQAVEQLNFSSRPALTPSAEATGYSGNTYLDCRPRGRSCSRLRAIFANNAHALNTLLELTAHSLSVSAAYEAIPLAIQRTLLAWALRLHHPKILEVLERHFGGTQLFNSLGRTYLWNNGRRYSLPELCIIGGVSANPSSGFDIPEPFFRIINHGRNHIQNLEASLGFLARHEPTIFAAPCDKARNALFFAIREGRTDAVRFLVSFLPCTAPGSLFNSPYNRWERCKEIHGLLYQKQTEETFKGEGSIISKKKQLQQMLAAAHREGKARSIISFSRSSQESLVRLYPAKDSFDAANDDGYEDPDEDSDLNTGSEVIEDACPHFGRGDHFPCFVGSIIRDAHYNDDTVEKMARSHDASNLVSYFPVQVWRSRVLIGNPDPKVFEAFDGIIRYPVMYMTAIAMSIHRDVQLARILVSSMPEAGMRGPCEWAAETLFESACLSLSSAGFDEPPLYYAAVREWDELAVLLMEHGASPQTPARHNVLKPLASRSGFLAQKLLMMASQSGVEKIITMEDVNFLLEKYPGFRHPNDKNSSVVWKLSKRRRILSWMSYYESPPADYIKLWEAISAANRAQQKKIRLPSPTHANADDSAPNNPILAAVLRRDLVALQHLLDFDDTFDVNALPGKWKRPHQRRRNWRLIFCPPRPTALDVVSWTANVEPSCCDESGLRLKTQDARIAAFLVAQGAVRGPDYVFEALLAKVLLQNVVLPFAILPLMAYSLYLSGVWTGVAIPQAEEMRNAAHNQTSVTGGVRSATETMFSVHCAVAASVPILMLYHFVRSVKGDRGFGEETRCCALCWPMVWVVLIAGTLANLITLSILGTVSEAGRVFGANLLAFFSLGICVLCIVGMLGLVCLAILFITSGHLVQLSDEVKNGSPFKYVWAATHSAFSAPSNGTATIFRQGDGAPVRQRESNGIMAR